MEGENKREANKGMARLREKGSQQGGEGREYSESQAKVGWVDVHIFGHTGTLRGETMQNFHGRGGKE